jgi:hypothetical protein
MQQSPLAIKEFPSPLMGLDCNMNVIARPIDPSLFILRVPETQLNALQFSQHISRNIVT